jgi:predicted ATPase
MTTERRNFFVVTGASGSGKSSIIAALSSLRYPCVAEVGRQVVRSQVETGGDATPWQNQRKFIELLLAGYIRAFESIAERSRPVFFDRGIPECLGRANELSAIDRAPFAAAAATYRYHPVVFFTAPWPEIYVNDAETLHTYEQGIADHQAELASYRAAGYRLAEVPRGPVPARAQFILSQVATMWPGQARVLASFEDADGARCVDVFERADGTFGFEQFRSELDGSSRWQSLHRFSQLRFESGEQALGSAKKRVPWLNPSEVWRW